MNKKKIREYLHFGYLPAVKNRYPFDISSAKPGKVPDNRSGCVTEMYKLFSKMIRNDSAQKPIVVPLSGGVDSRLILAGLFHELGPEQITAITFGVPESLDMKLAKQVTEKFNIRHHLMNLEEAEISEEKLLNFIRESEKPPVQLLDAFYNQSLRDHYGADVAYFSGFIGDRITGSIPRALCETESFEDALSQFLQNSRYDRTGFLPVLPPSAFTLEDDSCLFLSPYEKIDYRIRQMNMTVPIVLDKRYDIRTPLIDPDWVSFFYSLDSRFRDSQNLFFEMAAACYPDFFSIGIKNFFGAPIRSSQFRKNVSRKISYGKRVLHRKFPRLPVHDPLINYVDPYWFYVRNPGTAKMVEKSISDLAKRSVLKELDPHYALDKLKRGKMEYVRAVELLFNLEIYLKAGTFS
ncbi:MAG: asparagine synthase-related protein [Balneolaceae bacterium]